MELAEDVFIKAVHIWGINNWQRRMEQLLPDTTSSSEPPLAQQLSNHILSLEENFFWRAVKISEHTYDYLHSQCAYASELIGVVMTSESKLGVSS